MQILALLIVVATLQIVPGWCWFNRRTKQPAVLLALPAFGIAVWMLLVQFGVGKPGQVSFGEPVAVALAGVALAYLKFLSWDGMAAMRAHGVAAAFGSTAIAAALVRVVLSS
ncbi:hypothetical protein [Sinimarinibacterium sp. NLF-5-8]|uniref:hypothetical protein n=1 Tax=Sinimarinibacterium sp. NLF-5-8 TaxID=2698684 RepID=UPI00137BD714|nr:hypothetical protein [Sinimarinibacterium sp. NLF-5-8]QHS10649.1 hypothetical protein GT972_11215 [Sinimarinibacterium sp. NLF-5-8]